MNKLTQKQKNELNNLWFIFGNNGSKHTDRNHRFIQRFLDKDPPEDHRKFYKPTKECINAVDKILMEKK